MTLIVALDDPECAELAAVGGKAVNLHAMRAAELPVPDGVVVTTDAYRLATAPLAPALEPLFEQMRAAEPHDLGLLAARVREYVGLIDLPAELVRTLDAAYVALGAGTTDTGSPDTATDVPVAVRSSATSEDLADASFAGQQDTYLNVVGADAVRDAVLACFASLWTQRAVAYRHTHGIDPADVSLAVVVQRMVDARAAGVMFTADPITGTRTHTVVDANHGLGESVVSGEVNPDHYVLDSATGTVLARRTGDKAVAVRARAGGGVERETPQVGGTLTDDVLDDAALRDLAALGSRAQALFGAPQDTEWALDTDGRAWLTQARPVTTLYPLVQRAAPPPAPGRRIFLCASLAQGLTRPITPLGREAFKLITGGGARFVGFDVPDVRRGAPAYAEAGQRVFGDITAAVRNPLGRRLAAVAFHYMEARSATALSRLDADPDFAPATGGTRLVDAARGAVRIARMFAASRLPVRAVIALRDPDAAFAGALAEIEALRGELALPADADPATRLDAVEQVLSQRAPVVMPGVAGYALPGFVCLALARHLLAGRADPGELQDVLRGVPHNVTTQMDLELWDLSRRVGPDPSVEDLGPFLGRWGDRAVAEIDLGLPRWREEPEHLLGALRNLARVEDESAGPRAQFERGERAGADAARRLLEAAGSPARRVVVGFALDRARRLVGLREAPKLGLITLLARAREQFLAIGAALAADGRLERADDVVFLDLFTLRDAIGGADPARVRRVVAANRADYDAELRRRHVPRLLLSDGTELEALPPVAGAAGAAPGSAAPDDPRVLVGSPASAGVVTATARVVTEPVGAQLEPGEILVAPSTDPGWTPLFLTAGGLVMEMGGSNSHGAVVAREYGIPAVVGLAHAATRLRTGQRITVDGSAGTVTPD